MRFRINSIVIEKLQKGIALLRLLGFDHVKMKNMAIALALDGEREILRAFQTGRISRGPFSGIVIPLIDVLEFGTENSCMHIIEPAVEAKAVDVSSIGAVVAQPTDRSINRFIVRYERAAVAECAEILLNEETGGRGVAEFADFETIAVRADGLGVIFNHAELMLFGDFADGLHISALAVKVDRDDGLCLSGDRGFAFFRVNAFGLRIAIHEYRRCACDPDGFSGRKKCVRVSNDFVAFANPESHERQPDRVRAV